MRCCVSLVENRTPGCHIGVSVLWKELIIEVPDLRLLGKRPQNDLGQWLGNQPAGHIQCSMFLQIKFYWKTFTLVCVYSACGFICTKLTELNSDKRGPVVHKAKNIYHLLFSRKKYCHVLAFIWLFIMGIS